MIAIFISEEQILRNYFLASEWSILPSNEKILLLANEEIYPILSRLSARGDIPIDHLILPLQVNVAGNFLSNLYITVLRNLSKSSSVFRQIKKEQELGISSKIKSFARIILYKLSGVFPEIQNVVQFLLFYQSKNQCIEEVLIKSKARVAIALAITNPEDAIFLINAKRLGIRTIASTRSWDNLSSHGALLVVPDTLIIHSKLMRYQLQRYHKIPNKCQVLERKVPWYSNKFKPIRESKYIANPKHGIRVLYACTGPYHFPNETQYLDALFKKLQNTSIELTILQHPKSQHPLQLFTSEQKVKMFPYLNQEEKSSLVSYYQFLQEFDLIVGSGSTVLLDAQFLGKKVCAFFPEDISGYWASVSRYADSMQHYSEFISRLGIKIFYDLEDLAFSLYNIQTINTKNHDAVDYFVGEQHMYDFNLQEIIGQN